jgi:hypothetical protein
MEVIGYLKITEYCNAMFQTARCLPESDVGVEVEDALDETVKAAPSMESRAGAAVDSPIFRRASTLENLGLEEITLLDGGPN